MPSCKFGIKEELRTGTKKTKEQELNLLYISRRETSIMLFQPTPGGNGQKEEAYDASGSL